MAKLVVTEGPDRGTEYPLPEDPQTPQTIGRDPRNEIVLKDGSVSRQHLRIEFTGRGHRLVDIGSRNRTFLNGEPVREAMLQGGDTIGLGDTELRFEQEHRASHGQGMESTIIKELPATGEAGLLGILDSIAPAALREERLARALDGVRQILEISRAITRSGSLDDLYRELLEIVVPALEADRAVVLVREGSAWIPRAVHPPVPAEGASEEAPISESVVRRAAEEGKAILSANLRRDDRFRDKESVVQAGIVSAIAAPVHAEALPAPGAPGGTTRGGRSTGASTVFGVLYADRRGASRPFGEAELGLLTAAAQQAGNLARRISEESRLRDENRNLIRSISETKRIIGTSRACASVLEFIRRAAPAHQTILIRGETGTGKELVAAAIHYQSPRQGKPFVAINCAAIPENLIESELFGHERGAFTGAVTRRKGKFEMADGGTVFLDEVAELAPGCQAKLLRLLEERNFERVGGSQRIEVDVRVMAATNKELARAIAAGEFREDLFYRLNVLGITLPPLRERREDIPLLVEHFLEEMGKGRWTLAAEAREKLLNYSWPGNIRQLRNVLESAAVMGDGPVIRSIDLALPLPGESGMAGSQGWEPLTLEELQRRHIQKVLEFTGGNKKRAAQILGIERCTLYAKLKTIGGGSSQKAGPNASGQEADDDDQDKTQPEHRDP